MSAPVREGDVIAGKYRVEKVLGVGGMGVVVAAVHLSLDQRVAIKFLLPEALAHPDVVERFSREARAAARVRGRHVVRVIDVDALEDGRAYMVMEHLEGEDLEHVLERGPLPVDKAISYLLQVCEALAEAHAAGIVHRDLKPANLFLAQQPDRRPIIKVLDFGISKMTVAGEKQLTATSTAMGTPYYMSPEQLMSSRDVDARSDIWALGVILFELLSGTRPCDADSMPSIVAQILSNQRPLLRELRPDVPAAVEDVVGKCMQSSRDLRFATVADLATALGRQLPDGGQDAAERVARLLGAPSVPPPVDPTLPAPRYSGAPTALALPVALPPELVASIAAGAGGILSREAQLREPAPLVEASTQGEVRAVVTQATHAKPSAFPRWVVGAFVAPIVVGGLYLGFTRRGAPSDAIVPEGVTTGTLGAATMGTGLPQPPPTASASATAMPLAASTPAPLPSPPPSSPPHLPPSATFARPRATAAPTTTASSPPKPSANPLDMGVK